jgi:hypothetical protein
MLFYEGVERMVVATEKQVYELKHDLAHLADTPRERDAYIVEWPEYLDYRYKFNKSDYFKYPDNGVEFHGYESSLSNTDFPYNNVGWPIMSKRMLDALLEVREFPHRTWNVPFVGFPNRTNEEILRQGLAKNGIRHDDEFVAVQLLEHLDIFDWENSVYRMHSIFPDEVDRIRKLVLKVPEKGLPPIFRLTILSGHLYISPEGRAALEAANIRGVRFV